MDLLSDMGHVESHFNPIEHLGDMGHVESHFGLFGDRVSIRAR
jgi:hypothetical protein